MPAVQRDTRRAGLTVTPSSRKARAPENASRIGMLLPSQAAEIRGSRRDDAHRGGGDPCPPRDSSVSASAGRLISVAALAKEALLLPGRHHGRL